MQAAYPDIERSFVAAVEELERKPFVVDIAGKTSVPRRMVLDGHLFTTIILGSLYNRRLLPAVPLLIHELRRRNESLTTALLTYLQQVQPKTSRGLNFAVNCYELAPFNGPQKRARQMNHLPPALKRLDWDTQWWPDPSICEAYHPYRAASAQRNAVTSATPALVFTGEFDPTSHRSYGPLLARTLANSQIVEIPGAGHNEGIVHDCTWGMAIRFVDDPTRTIAVSRRNRAALL